MAGSGTSLQRCKGRYGGTTTFVFCDGSPYTDASGADWADNDTCFGRLGLAAADIACGLGDPTWMPDRIHLNDWPTALAPAFLAWRGRRTLIHNLAHRGLFSRERLGPLGIPVSAFQINGVEFCWDISILKAGIFYASHLTTVSSTYAGKITAPQFPAAIEMNVASVRNVGSGTEDVVPGALNHTPQCPNCLALRGNRS